MKNTMKLSALTAVAIGMSLAVTAHAGGANVPATLKGKLIENKGGTVQDASIPASLDYYVLYHSASW